jgi:hypothetical protein
MDRYTSRGRLVALALGLALSVAVPGRREAANGSGVEAIIERLLPSRIERLLRVGIEQLPTQRSRQNKHEL